MQVVVGYGGTGPPMAVRVTLDKDKDRVIRWLVSGQCTVEDLNAAIATNRELRAEADETMPWYLIIEATEDMRVSMDALAPISYMLRRESAGKRTVIRVGGSYFIRSIDKLFSRVFNISPSEVLYVDTLEEAYAHINACEAQR